MDDLIRRQSAIDALREAENHAFNSFYKGLVKAHKIIANIPSAQQEQHWIPCSERLPDKEAIYIVSLSKDTDFCKYIPGIGFGWYSRGAWYKNNDVTAWMEMPEPYNERIVL